MRKEKQSTPSGVHPDSAEAVLAYENAMGGIAQAYDAITALADEALKASEQLHVLQTQGKVHLSATLGRNFGKARILALVERGHQGTHLVLFKNVTNSLHHEALSLQEEIAKDLGVLRMPVETDGEESAA